VEESMEMDAMTPNDLEAMADEMLERDEEQRMWAKLDAESELNLEEDLATEDITGDAGEYLSEEEQVEKMIAETFGAESEKEDLKVALFKKDGDYGYVEFAGIFDSLESVILYAGKEGEELAVADGLEEVEHGDSLDFFILDVTTSSPEVVFGARLMKVNSLA